MDQRPTIVCLCGSTRFKDEFVRANFRETLRGKIVLSIGCDLRSDAELFAHYTEEEMAEITTRFDELHKRKIDLADAILVLDVDGYVGHSTSSEIDYAVEHGEAR